MELFWGTGMVMVVYAGWCMQIDMIFLVFFFFKQKTAYEMRISDWSSDVCSSDLARAAAALHGSGTVAPSLRRPAGMARYPGARRARHGRQLGRASCRERVCQYV